MKKIFFGVVVVLMTLVSCMDTSYEQPEQIYANVGVTAMLGNDYLFINDGGEKLLLKQLPADYEFEKDVRVKITFKNPVKAAEGYDYDYIVTVSSIENVIVKDLIVIDDLNRDTLGDAGVFFNNVYLAGRYLNVDITFSASNKPHYFNVSYDPDAQSDDENEIIFIFHHKDNDDYQGANYRGFISYDIFSIDQVKEIPYNLIFKGIDLSGEEYEKIIEVTE